MRRLYFSHTGTTGTIANGIRGHFSGDTVQEIAFAAIDFNGSVIAQSDDRAERIIPDDLMIGKFIVVAQLFREEVVSLIEPVETGRVDIKIDHIIQNPDMITVVMAIA